MCSIRLTVIFLVAQLLAQTEIGLTQIPGTIQGTVVGPEGGFIEEATVVLTSLTDGMTIGNFSTNEDGRYSSLVVPSGLYTVRAHKDTLGSEIFRVRIRKEQTVKVNFMLEPGRRISAYLAEASERDALTRFFTAGIKFNRSEKHKQAIESFLRAIELSPACIECHFNLAVSYTELGLLSNAEMEFKRVIFLKPDYAAAYYGLSSLYIQQGQPEEAAAARSEANRIALDRLEIGRVQAEYAVERGITFFEAGNLTDAIGRFEYAIDQDSNLASGYYWLGIALEQFGRLTKARSSLQRYLQIDPEGEFAIPVRKLLDNLIP